MNAAQRMARSRSPGMNAMMIAPTSGMNVTTDSSGRFCRPWII